MRKVILLNAAAGSAGGAEALSGSFSANASRFRPAGNRWILLDTAHLASKVVHAGCDLLLVAGGDGTIHAVVNALAPDVDRVCLGVLPLGTGNDLCRTLGVPEDPHAALAALDSGPERRLDLIEAHTAIGVYTIANVASGGFSGQVHDVLTPELKASWGPLAYLRGAVGALSELHGYATQIRIDDGPVETHGGDLINVIVANGRYAAHGWRVASLANPEDGLLDVVMVLDGNLFDLTDVAAQLLTGDYLNSVSVMHMTSGARASSGKRCLRSMWFSFDGEPETNEPLTFAVRPGRCCAFSSGRSISRIRLRTDSGVCDRTLPPTPSPKLRRGARQKTTPLLSASTSGPSGSPSPLRGEGVGGRVSFSVYQARTPSSSVPFVSSCSSARQRRATAVSSGR